ncbi:putative RNA-directed DNA polymerase from transposon BS [Trichonephila clavipes]|uniref:Putative RNA-directed DNA polymerase from transposon BS n=1 Tax=Trichonephila clavipes TaxID=2585209 RepID=A0A8X6WBT6_TRICX|nr:putative RNA-directed DNA polymerase from transposon BS [Trichonephila clavipes]
MSRLTFNKADKNTERQVKLAVHKCRSSDFDDPVFLVEFSMHELLLVLNALDQKKSPGPDNVHGVMIVHLCPSGTQRLLDIFNQSRKSGRLPHEWKRATIIPIRKPGKTAITCFHGNNMDLGGDIVQKIRFCTFANVSDAQNLKKPTNHTAAAFLDLSKALDTVWRNKLILKIQGVPQGSVLSPTLFSMFLAGVEKLITENSSNGLFADDIVLWHSSHDIPSIEANLSQC